MKQAWKHGSASTVVKPLGKNGNNQVWMGRQGAHVHADVPCACFSHLVPMACCRSDSAELAVCKAGQGVAVPHELLAGQSSWQGQAADGMGLTECGCNMRG